MALVCGVGLKAPHTSVIPHASAAMKSSIGLSADLGGDVRHKAEMVEITRLALGVVIASSG